MQDGFAEKISVLLDSVDELIDDIIKQNYKQKQILKQLEKVEMPYRLILEDVYIQGKSLVEVASDLGYSYVDVCRKHGIALTIFDKCY